MRITRRLAALVCVGVVITGQMLVAQQNYRQELQAWRDRRDMNLRGDNSWLTVAGLVFLKPGRNTFGAGPLNDVVLPEGSDVGTGVLELDGGRVHLVSKKPVVVNNTRTTAAEIRPATDDRPADRVTLGPVSFFLMRSGDRIAVRLRDQNSQLRLAFTGLKWFPANDAFNVVARFEPYARAKEVKVPNILGDLDPFQATGLLAFALEGKTYKLEVYDIGGAEPLFIVFKDLTSGHETYPAARFLNAARPNTKGETALDFNKAYNPPCAYNPYTTCPLPRAQNRLNIRIEAGELDYHRQH
jgi:uncharacterized protein (DUF1684 family)